MGYRTPGLTHLLDRQCTHVWFIGTHPWKLAGEMLPRAPGFSRSNLHVCQNLTFASQMFFSSKMFGCHCQLVTADWRRYLMCSFVFPHFINYIVTWSSGRVHFISFWRNFLVHSNINPRKSEFEFVAFKLLDFERIQSSDSQDPDKNFFNAFNFKDSQYFTSKDFSRNLNYFDKSSASTLHLNIRSLQKKKKEIKQKWTGAENLYNYLLLCNFWPLLQNFYFWKENWALVLSPTQLLLNFPNMLGKTFL